MDLVKNSGDSFDFRFVANKYCSTPPVRLTCIYRFKIDRARTFIVECVQHDYDLYIIKFYPKGYDLSKKKYKVLTGYGWGNARKIVRTIIKIGLHILNKNPKASFGFLGFPREHELAETKLENTGRYRLYKRLINQYVSDSSFDHHKDESLSMYLILNKKTVNSSPSVLDSIIVMIQKNYDTSEYL